MENLIDKQLEMIEAFENLKQCVNLFDNQAERYKTFLTFNALTLILMSEHPDKYTYKEINEMKMKIESYISSFEILRKKIDKKIREMTDEKKKKYLLKYSVLCWELTQRMYPMVSKLWKAKDEVFEKTIEEARIKHKDDAYIIIDIN